MTMGGPDDGAAACDTIGSVGSKVKIAAGLFWADYAVLGAQIAELESAGVDWFHIEVRDGKYTSGY